MNRKHCNFCFHFKRSWNVKKKEKDKFPDESIGLELKFVPKPGKKNFSQAVYLNFKATVMHLLRLNINNSKAVNSTNK